MVGDPRLSRLVVSEEHIQSINACLDRLIEEGNTQYALLLDLSGQLVTWCGEVDQKGLDALGALLAGNFASAREIAKLLGEDSFSAVFQEGHRRHVFTALVSQHWMLAVVFDARTPVGLVKLLCHRASADLQAVYKAVCQQDHSTVAGWALGDSFRVLAQRTIDSLLQDGK
jgi:predicted regulator of Ras-like GTPase activity (Roadblock/LC7/MglB family)